MGDQIPFHILGFRVGNWTACPALFWVAVGKSEENLQLLRQRYYYATWKADGTRYMMLITMDGCYLVDRCFNFRRVQMRFPLKLPNGAGVSERTHHYTLLDGEMIIDKLPDSQKQERRYLIYDMMAINQVSVIELYPDILRPKINASATGDAVMDVGKGPGLPQ
ncbi:hypothetical protein Pint_35236 [Pistacia integerrima]|uniref:Uncharacterized protein n=1 Tax=Pistacia integerrima TaxID=434235 RepID=A0ACC0Y305_9ROSI|nr:hypothetical protein Pint_35236 [Pistacia integerrima]